MKLSLIREAWGGAAKYKMPTDPRHVLYDFYMLSAIKNTGDRKTDYVIDEIMSNFLPSLKQHFIDLVYYAMTEEIVYAFVYDPTGDYDGYVFSPDVAVYELRRSDNPELADVYVRLAERMNPIDDFSFGFDDDDHLELIGGDIELPAGDDVRDMLDEAFGGNKATIVRFIRTIFKIDGAWARQYGGIAWARIANAWFRLNAAKSEGDMIVAIDHVYSLEHNTGSIFTKVDEYSKGGGYNWIADALDNKFKAKSPSEFIYLISPQLRQIALRALKIKYGTTLQTAFKHRDDADAEKWERERAEDL